MDVNIPSRRVSYFKSSMPAHLKCILHSHVLPSALRKITARWVVGAAHPEMTANSQEARKVGGLAGHWDQLYTSVNVCKLECMLSVMLAMCIISYFVRQLSPMSFSAEGGTLLILKLTRDQTRVKGRETVLLCTQAGYADILKERKKKKRKIYGIALASSLFPCFLNCWIRINVDGKLNCTAQHSQSGIAESVKICSRNLVSRLSYSPMLYSRKGEWEERQR